MRVSVQNVQTNHQEDLKKNKENTLKYMTNINKKIDVF